MKKFTLITLLILFTNCAQDNVANDSERNWCIGKAQRGETLLLLMKSDSNEALRTEYFDIIFEIGTAEIIYRNDYDSNPPGLLKVKEKLLSNDEEALRFCKIWTDIGANNE